MFVFGGLCLVNFFADKAHRKQVRRRRSCLRQVACEEQRSMRENSQTQFGWYREFFRPEVQMHFGLFLSNNILVTALSQAKYHYFDFKLEHIKKGTEK